MRTPPIDFGMAWTDVGERRRRGESLPLHVAASPTLAFQDAYRHARDAMVSAGYSWTDLHVGANLLPCWWDHGVECDVAALQAAADAGIAKGAADRLQREREAEERRAAERARERAELAEVRRLSAPIRAELDAMLASRPWAFGRKLREARDLASPGDWTRHGMRVAEELLDSAEANIERAQIRLNRPSPAEWYARAADLAVRDAALEACRVLSARDEDWASDRNGIGWSQATSWTGHVLSEKATLDQGEAGHALHLLHTHRRQLPTDLRARVFGTVPAPAPEAQPALAL